MTHAHRLHYGHRLHARGPAVPADTGPPWLAEQWMTIMSTFKYAALPVTQVHAGAHRRVAHTDHLMLTIMDFADGPQAQPDPPHCHPHEQVSYVAEGEILFFLGDDPPVHLAPGDGYTVPPNVPHAIQRLTPRVRLVDAFTPLRQDFLPS